MADTTKDPFEALDADTTETTTRRTLGPVLDEIEAALGLEDSRGTNVDRAERVLAALQAAQPREEIHPQAQGYGPPENANEVPVAAASFQSNKINALYRAVNGIASAFRHLVNGEEIQAVAEAAAAEARLDAEYWR